MELFEALKAIDKKDYKYYARLSPEDKKSFAPFLLMQWLSTVSGKGMLQEYYLLGTNLYANKYLTEMHKHPELQWLMLCSASPDMGVQRHVWTPVLKKAIQNLDEVPKKADIKKYVEAVYGKGVKDAEEMFTKYCKMAILAELYPTMKQADIEALSEKFDLDYLKKYREEWYG
jgi:hypothetical protein